MIHEEKSVVGWRVLVLPGIVMAAVLTSLDNLPGRNISDIVTQYQSLFTPAGYSLAVIAIVFVSFLVYGIWQLQSSQRQEEIYDHLAKPLVLSTLMVGAWILCLRLNWMGISLAFAITTLIIALMMYVQVRNDVLKNGQSAWLSLPFSLLAGWLSVAVLINASLFFASLGWTVDPSTKLTVAIILMSIASLWAVWVGYRSGDFVFPSTVSWLCIGIFSEHGLEYSYWGAIILACAIFPVIWIIVTVIRRVVYRHKIHANKFSFPE